MFVARQSTPPTMSIAMLDMESAVEDNYRKYPRVTVPYSPQMHSNCASYCYWFDTTSLHVIART